MKRRTIAVDRFAGLLVAPTLFSAGFALVA